MQSYEKFRTFKNFKRINSQEIANLFKFSLKNHKLKVYITCIPFG